MKTYKNWTLDKKMMSNKKKRVSRMGLEEFLCKDYFRGQIKE